MFIMIFIKGASNSGEYCRFLMSAYKSASKFVLPYWDHCVNLT